MRLFGLYVVAAKTGANVAFLPHWYWFFSVVNLYLPFFLLRTYRWWKLESLCCGLLSITTAFSAGTTINDPVVITWDKNTPDVPRKHITLPFDRDTPTAMNIHGPDAKYFGVESVANAVGEKLTVAIFLQSSMPDRAVLATFTASAGDSKHDLPLVGM